MRMSLRKRRGCATEGHRMWQQRAKLTVCHTGGGHVTKARIEKSSSKKLEDAVARSLAERHCTDTKCETNCCC